MTVTQAIKEGYQHWMYSSDGFQPMRDLKELLGEDADFIFQREIELVDKDSYHPAGIDATDLLELIGDQLQEDHSGESGDDTDGVSDAIKSIDIAVVQPLIDAIQSKLEGLNYYRSSGITLTRNDGTIGTQDGDQCNRDGCAGTIVEEDTIDQCTCHLGHPPCAYCTTDRHFCPECGWNDTPIE